MNIRSRTFKIFVLILLLSLGGLAWYAYTMRSKASQTKEAPIKVFKATEITQPQSQALSGRIEMSGVLVATEMATLRSKSAGTLMRLNVQEGQLVQKGQLLAEIDARDLHARTSERESALMAAQRSHQVATTQHKANQNLAQQGFISETALASSLANLSTSLAQLKSAEAAMTSHAKLLQEATITAPFEGVIARRLVNVGETLAPEQEVLTVVNPARLEFKTLVDSAAGQFLKVGKAIDVQFETQDKPMTGSIDRIGPGNDVGARALPVYVKLKANAAPAQVLRPGLMGTAQFAYDLAKTGLTLPVTAVQEEGGKSIVWVIQDGVLKRQTVTTGLKDTQGLRVSVLEGVKASDSVLALRFEGLKEGTKVEVMP